MIFVAVGTQFPFDRLVRAVDDWAVSTGYNEVYGQIGPTDFKPRAIKAEAYLTPQAFSDYCRKASILVAHAGMGLIISALEMGKPVIIMPRRASLGEQRNEHQLATAKRFGSKAGVYVADDVEALRALLDRRDSLKAGGLISNTASPELVAALRAFVDANR